MRKTRLLLLAFALLLVILVVFGGGSLLRAGIEKGTAAATGLPTEVESASLGVFRGRVGVRGFRLGNPPGFKSPSAFAVGRVSVDASLLSLLTDTVVVESIEVLEPELTIELSGRGTNIGEILDRFEGKGGSGGGKEPSDGEEGPSGSGGKKLRVAEVRIRGAKVHVAASGLAAAQTTITLGDLTLHELGSGAKGKEPTLPQLVARILGSLALAAAREGDLSSRLAEILRRETARPLLEGLRRDLDAATHDAVDKAVEEIDRAVGGKISDLLKEKKKK
ncbi:MAG: AsmA family protein [Planctomycetes bacterium]|nr:AsmA family protein [Planctomycetota bacterium]